MDFENQLLIALGLAEKAHEGQKDKVGADYILHPKKVAEYCSEPAAKIVALLHDVIEDSDITLDDLVNAGVNEKVAAAVDCLTKQEGESLEDYYNRVASDDLAVEVKFADMRHNSDIARWPEDMQKKALENTRRYMKRIRLLYDLIGKVRAESILSKDMLDFINL